MKLREYQQECKDIIDGMEKGSGLVSMATGLGKTVIFSHLNRRGRMLILSHRDELVRQPEKYFENCTFGVEEAKDVSHGEDVVSASVQSMSRRLKKFSPDDFDIIVTDEAHHAAAPTYKKIYSYFKPRLHIGFTATPNRGDGVRLDDVFDKIIYQKDLKWGIANNYLSDVNCLRVKVSYNLNHVKKQMGDFQLKSLDEAVNISSANREIADIYKKLHKGQTLIFAASVSHAENIAGEIDGAVVISANTENRQDIIAKFTARKIPCIVNCMIFTEGTDIPLIETIIIARPTQNASLYTQMVGRGLRKYEGKDELTLIDCVGISEKLDICTAPSLLGLDVSDVPANRQDKIEGRLSDMRKIIDYQSDNPATWKLSVQTIYLFAQNHGVDIHNVKWTKMCDGHLVYQFTDGNRIGIQKVNELGRTKVMYYLYDEETRKFKYSESEEMFLQYALDEAWRFFHKNYSEEQKLWDMNYYYKWSQGEASEKQIEVIKKSISDGEWAEINENGLSKGEASLIIDRIVLNSKRVRHKEITKKAISGFKKNKIENGEQLDFD